MTIQQLLKKACREIGKRPNELQSVYKDVNNNYVFCFLGESDIENGNSAVTSSCDDDIGSVYIAMTPNGEVDITAPYLWTEEVASTLNGIMGESAP